MNGVKPPNQPLPRWYGSDMDVYRMRAGYDSTRNAAIGPYDSVTSSTCAATSSASTMMFGCSATAAAPSPVMGPPAHIMAR